MPANNYVRDTIATELNTPRLAEWLIGQIQRLRDAAPPMSQVRLFADEHHAGMLSALEFYRDNRQGSRRGSSHSNLIDKTVAALNTLRQIIHPHLAGDSPLRQSLGGHPALTGPEHVEQLISNAIDHGRWRSACPSCGGVHTTPLQAMEGVYLCNTCLSRHTRPCQCEGNPRRRSTTQHVIELPDGGIELRDYCPACRPTERFQCQRCSNHYVGQPTTPEGGGGPGYNLRLCRECSRRAARCRCGRVSISLEYRLPGVVENAEDDGREHVETRRDDARVCRVCYDEFTADCLPQYWDRPDRPLRGRSFEEIGSKRTYGVELEVCHASRMKLMRDLEFPEVWHAKRDGSLPETGVELASTILSGDEGLEAIRELCRFATENNWAVDRRAGFHLHVGLDRETMDQVAAVAFGYLATYRLWSCWVAKSRVKNQYCTPFRIPGSLDEFHKRSSEDIVRFCQGGQGRYHWVNWAAYGKFKTVEVRYHQGTLDYPKIANWVKAHTRFVDWCVEQGTAKKVYEALSKHRDSARNTFLFMSQVIWKDRPLGRWFRNRAQIFAHGKEVLPMPVRKLRKEGIDPATFADAINGHLQPQSASAPAAAVAAVDPEF